MDRRKMIIGAAALPGFLSASAQASELTSDSTRTFLEIKTWHLHNSQEDQAKRVSAYLESGLFPALTRAGAKPVAAFANLIGPDGPYFVTITQYTSLAIMQDVLTKLASDEAHEKASQRLSADPGLPFVTIDSSVLHSLSIIPEPVIPTDIGSRPAESSNSESINPSP
jgi:hypothetical protein